MNSFSYLTVNILLLKGVFCIKITYTMHSDDNKSSDKANHRKHDISSFALVH